MKHFSERPRRTGRERAAVFVPRQQSERARGSERSLSDRRRARMESAGDLRAEARRRPEVVVVAKHAVVLG